MKFRIHDSNDENDWFDVEGETLEECREKAKHNSDRLGWEMPWSERLEN